MYLFNVDRKSTINSEHLKNVVLTVLSTFEKKGVDSDKEYYLGPFLC